MQDSYPEYMRHGQIPFFRLPLADSRDPRPYDGAAAVLLGVTYDGGSTFNPGTRFAPRFIRQASANSGNQATRERRILDGGNILFPFLDSGRVRERIQEEVGRVLEAGAAPFIVGGDHSITLPVLRAVAAQHGPLAVVQVDSHPDTSGEDGTGDPFHHGAPLRHALEEGLIEPGQLYQIGLRMEGDPDFARRYGIREIWIDAVEEAGIAAVMTKVREGIGGRPLYVTFDIDALDPAFAPGTGILEPGGLTSREALHLMRSLAGLRFVGMDLVEVLPASDHASITCQLAARILLAGLALVP